jgi:hypothetical protein
VAHVDANDGGAPYAIATGQLEPQELTLSPTTVFWTNAGRFNDAGVAELATGSVASVSRGGGKPMTLAAKLDEPLAIQYGVGPGETPTLVWSADGVNSAAGTVSQLVLGGSLTVVGGALELPYGVAMNSTNAYWLSSAGSEVVVQTSALAGSPATQLGLSVAEDSAGCLAVHGNQLFFTAADVGGGGALFEMPLTGGTPVQRWSTTTGRPFGVALDAENVYWAVESSEGGVIYQMEATLPTGPPPTPTPIAVGLKSAFFVAVDSKNVYFATNIALGSVFRVPIGGGSMVELAKNIQYPGAVAADDIDEFVYFTALTSIGAVKKQ